MELGYALMTEEHDPRALVANARLAQEVGFDYLTISDHFHPWISAQGQAPFAWSVMGALREASSLPIVTQVTCPIKRYHPAIVAQAAATVAAMGEAPLTLGVGTGEALSEHIVGGEWPSPHVRLQMLDEALSMITSLLSGREVSVQGEHFTLDRAQLYTLPEQPVRIGVAVSGERSVARAAAHGELITTAPKGELVEQYREQGGTGRCYGQASMCYGPDRETAEATMLERWRHTPFDWSVNAELPTPEAFETATGALPDEAITGGAEPIGPDLDVYHESVDAYRQAGFDGVAVHNVGPDQERFLRTVGAELVDQRR